MVLTQEQISKILSEKKKLAQPLLFAIKEYNPDVNDLMFVANTLLYVRGNREVAKDVISKSNEERMMERCALLDFIDAKMRELGIDGKHGAEDAKNEIYCAASIIGFAANLIIFGQ